MAGVGGVILGGLLMGCALQAFGGTNNRYSDQYNLVTESLGEVIQRSMQSTTQAVLINQTIKIEGAIFYCPNGFSATNTNNVEGYAIGTFDSKSTAEIINAINNSISNEIRNDTNVKTSFFGSLPPNTNATDMERNIHQVVRQVFTSENLNTMRQSLQANQIQSFNNVLITGATCTLTNNMAVKMMAQTSLRALTQALYNNSFTNQFMTSLSNKYVGVAQGIFGPLEGFLQVLAWGIVGVLVIVGIVVGIGLVLKLTQKKPAETTTPTTGGLSPAALALLASS